MVLQYKNSDGKWEDYTGKTKMVGKATDYSYRLLNKSKSKIIAAEGNYNDIMKIVRESRLAIHD